MSYRSPTERGPNFAPWLRALRNQSGVYIIRGLGGRVLYVGESHTGQLAKTITRHFHSWSDSRDRKHFTYDRKAVQIRIVTCPPSAASGLQDKIIRRLRPRDNSNGFSDQPF